MMIIDFRVRPPYKSILEAKLWQKKPRSEQKWGLPTAQSVIEESMHRSIFGYSGKLARNSGLCG